MKVTFLFISFFISIFIIPTYSLAQHKIEAFTVNQKIGIVDIESLEEYLPPTYPKGLRVKFNSDYLAFRNENDSLIAINKTTLAWIPPILLSNRYPVFKINGLSYLHAIMDNKSVIMDSLLEKQYTFPRSYDDVQQVESNTQFIYAEKNDSIDLYKIEGKTLELIHKDISANRFSKEFLVDQVGEQIETYVFYGVNQLYLFDKQLKFLKTIKSNTMYSADLFDLINPTSNNNEKLTFQGPKVYSDQRNSKELEEISKIGNTKVYSNHHSNFVIAISDQFKLTSYDAKNIIVYEVFEKSTNGMKSVSYSASQSYEFMIDEIGLKALLPLKYQEKIGFKMMKK